MWARPAFYLGQNRISVVGAALTTSAGLTMVGLWMAEVIGGEPWHAYGTGIVMFIGLPAMFVLGLLLMPLGIWLRLRKLRKAGQAVTPYPPVDLHNPIFLRGLALFAIATVANVGIVGTGAYRAVHYMDSTSFCGTACHSVMAPEYTAFVDSPHSRVGCVQCHIGPGASWFVKSKLSGARQLVAVTLGTYSRPIPSPVHELRPARDTCEQCHWPSKFHGDKLVVKEKYADDEANTRTVSVLMLRIGGTAPGGRQGIHGLHLDRNERIRYTSTNRRQTISEVSYVGDDGRTVKYTSEDAPRAAGAAGAEPPEHRVMDCIDCHNRPTHSFPLPERAVDQAIIAGRIGRQLPYVKKKAVELLRAQYPDREAARQAIEAGLPAFYREKYPDVQAREAAAVEAAAAAVRDIYLRNVFPDMKLTWGTHPNNIGHDDFPGCFRCHDDKHKSADGKVISQDCEACHAVLAMEEEDPKVLAELGLK
jgi:nitrate/TMAO reductase-like tetraheme cytochrome c subunit